MTTKLTLSVEKNVILKAKQYAEEHRKSLSELVAAYLMYLTKESDQLTDIDPEIEALSDEIPVSEIPDINDIRFQYLKDKYLHE